MGPLLRGMFGLVVSGTVFTGFVGFLHTPAGKPLLRAFAGTVGCPIGQPLDEAGRAAAFEVAIAPFRGRVPATSEAALTFGLGTTTRTDVAAWAAHHGITCTDDEGMRCSDVPGTALAMEAPRADLVLQFDGTDRIYSVDLSTPPLTPQEAAALVDLRVASLERTTGPATSQRGVADATFLSGPLSQASASFHYADVRAELSATNLGARGVVVRESYQRL